jgi:hypothetical protein
MAARTRPIASRLALACEIVLVSRCLASFRATPLLCGEGVIVLATDRRANTRTLKTVDVNGAIIKLTPSRIEFGFGPDADP